MRRWFVILGSLLVAALVGYGIGRKCPKIETKVQIDTLVIRDTLCVLKPVEITKTVVQKVLVKSTDTLTIRDTLYSVQDREEKTYESKDYKAVVSGIMPSLDYIAVYPETKIITKDNFITSRKSWGFSIGAGPGVIYSPFNKGIDAGIGVWCGLTYTF